MDTKFTKGTWRLGPKHKVDGSYAIHAGSASVVHLTPFSSSIRQAEANAHLIAAAPDLYEALEDAIEVMEFVYMGAAKQPKEIAAARTALAKARGENK